MAVKAWPSARVAEEEKFGKKWRREGYFCPFWSLKYTGAKRRLRLGQKHSKKGQNKLFVSRPKTTFILVDYWLFGLLFRPVKWTFGIYSNSPEMAN